MKYLLMIILFLTAFNTRAQEFAPIGAEWYYNEQFAFSGDINYIRFTSVKDTLIFGENCKKIIKRHKLFCNDRPDVEYLFSKNDTVFFLDTIFNEFQILYVFNASRDDSWIIKIKDEEQDIDTLTITVDSIKFTTINGEDLKTMFVTYHKDDENNPETYPSKIIEKIGDTHYLFHWYPWSAVACDGNYSGGLRCYQDPSIGLYSTGIVDSCDYVYIWTSVENRTSLNEVEIFPNPTRDFVTIKVPDGINFTIQLIDRNGKIVRTAESTDSNLRMDLSSIDQGIYILSVTNDQQIIRSEKLTIMK